MDSNINKNENYVQEVKIIEDLDIESLWNKFFLEVLEKWEYDYFN
jgi:hypothetical protein